MIFALDIGLARAGLTACSSNRKPSNNATAIHVFAIKLEPTVCGCDCGGYLSASMLAQRKFDARLTAVQSVRYEQDGMWADQAAPIGN